MIRAGLVLWSLGLPAKTEFPCLENFPLHNFLKWDCLCLLLAHTLGIGMLLVMELPFKIFAADCIVSSLYYFLGNLKSESRQHTDKQKTFLRRFFSKIQNQVLGKFYIIFIFIIGSILLLPLLTKTEDERSSKIQLKLAKRVNKFSLWAYECE